MRALLRARERLHADDGLAVIAFADRALQLVAADSTDQDGQIRAAVALLSRGVEASGLGDGTRLADGLRLAMEAAAGTWLPADGKGELAADLTEGRQPIAGSQGPGRLLLISDGLLEDRTACGAWVERIAEAGIPLSCTGVGDQFDEEWLMWAADMTRGRFRYAPPPTLWRLPSPRSWSDWSLSWLAGSPSVCARSPARSSAICARYLPT